MFAIFSSETCILWIFTISIKTRRFYTTFCTKTAKAAVNCGKISEFWLNLLISVMIFLMGNVYKNDDFAENRDVNFQKE